MNLRKIYISEISSLSEEQLHALNSSPEICGGLFRGHGEQCSICNLGIQDHRGLFQTLTLTRDEMRELFPELVKD
jgi:hypothetical protein